MTTITRLVALITLFVIPAAMALDVPHCVVNKEYPIIITQCDDGTVTVANVSKGKASVCRNRKGELCREIPL
ncbi:hypothetical protein BRR54_09430 [Salmonella enterica]|nr:hypothetical protein [Salmonella enterica]EBR1113830.1 hypothetical protein [Salmonella enterica]EDM0872842.1 hypothetical protein [Salmonella enterica]EEN6706337.1 hypothetical protein [Salmonella enterica subsp. enterica serovar Rubislaw]EID6347693.1 hypothetical protein [Salmonella enterica]